MYPNSLVEGKVAAVLCRSTRSHLLDGEVQQPHLVPAGLRGGDPVSKEAPGARQEAVHPLHAVRVPHLEAAQNSAGYRAEVSYDMHAEIGKEMKAGWKNKDIQMRPKPSEAEGIET